MRPRPPSPHAHGQPRTTRAGERGVTLIEMLVSVTILTVIVLVLGQLFTGISDRWVQSETRVETYQSARGALELITRELTPAAVDTRMQFAVVPGDGSPGNDLKSLGAPHVAPGSNALLWMAPLGQDGALTVVGYYLYRDDERRFYRLKRLFIPEQRPDDPGVKHPYFPAMSATEGTGLSAGGATGTGGSWTLATSQELRVSPTDARWFWKPLSVPGITTKKGWDVTLFDEELSPSDTDYPLMSVSTAADNVIAFWIQPLDTLGNPIPWLHDRFGGTRAPNHPPADMIYNSAAYMEFANTTPFSDSPELPWDDDQTTVFLAQTEQSLKANRVPAAIDITLVTLDSRNIARGFDIPLFPHVMTSGPDGYGTVLDVEASLQQFNQTLADANIKSARTFTTRVKLLNGT